MKYMSTHIVVAVLASTLLLLGATIAMSDTVMYGGNGGQPSSTNDGALVIINQATGAIMVVGNPTGVSRISGLAFDSTGALWGATQASGGFPPPPGPTSVSDLINLNPANGQLLSSVPIKDTLGTGISIADLAVQPGTDMLFGIRGPIDQLNGQGNLYTIDKKTGVATLVGNTGDFFGSIAFAPNGTLYMSAADLDPMGNIVNQSLKTLNPSNANILSTFPTNDFFGALGIRPTDGMIFGGTGSGHTIFTINPTTGAETLVGDTGLNFVGDIDFTPIPIPLPSTMLLFGSGLLGLTGLSRKFKRN